MPLNQFRAANFAEMKFFTPKPGTEKVWEMTPQLRQTTSWSRYDVVVLKD